MAWTKEWIIIHKPLWGQDMWENIWHCLLDPEAAPTVLHVPAHKALTPPGNQEAGALACMQTLATEPLVHMADSIHGKSSYCSVQVG